MNKLKVSTNHELLARERANKVLNVLKEYPEGIFPKIIALYTKINENTVKSILIKLKNKGVVSQKEGMRGLYCLVEKDIHGSIFDWNFHDTTFSCLIKDYSGEMIEEIFHYGTIKYHFRIGKGSKKASVVISSNIPINISSIFACYSFFAYWVKERTNFFPEIKDTLISSIEFNKDYTNLGLRGIKEITLERLLDQFKLYQKGFGIRAEYKIKVPFPFEAIMSMLINVPISLDLTNSIFQIESDQDKINDSLKRIIALLTALLEKGDRHI